ncbi:MAG: ParA family protein [Eubacterium sp.]|nr:ParA family protein [Eubacterium sp.]
MCMVYSVTSQKGGVAKTTTVSNMGAYLAKRGYRVLLIDTDPQGSLTASLGFGDPDEMDTTIANVMEKEINDEDYDRLKFAILHHPEGMDVLPGNIELSGVEVTLVNTWSREFVLKKYVDHVKEHYDYIIFDCASNLSLTTINSLVASDKVIIPVHAAYLSLKALEQLIKTVSRVKRGLNSKLGIDGILLTMFNGRTNYAKGIVELLDKAFTNKIRVYDHKIPFSVRASEISAEGVSIFEHDPKGKVAEAYKGFAEEVLANE